MKLALATNETILFTSSKPEVAPVFPYVDGTRSETQAVDKETGLPLWTATVEFIQGETAQQGTKVKIASKDVPELAPRTEYKINGSLTATPYLVQGTKNVGISLLIVGSLVSSRASLPSKD